MGSRGGLPVPEDRCPIKAQLISKGAPDPERA